MLFDQAIDVQSMYSRPSASQTLEPAALVMTRPGSLPVDHPLSRASRPAARSCSLKLVDTTDLPWDYFDFCQR